MPLARPSISIRLVAWRYQFTTLGGGETGWWRREEIGPLTDVLTIGR